MTLLEGMILLSFIVWALKKIFLTIDDNPDPNLKSKTKNQKSKVTFRKISDFQFLISDIIPNSKKNISRFLNYLKDNIKFVLPVFLFLAAATISATISPAKTAALGIWKAYFIEPILFLVVLVDIVGTKSPSAQDAGHNQEYAFIASALGISALYISLIAIYQKFTGAFVPEAFWQQARVTSVFPYPNAIGLYLAPIIIILFGAFISPFFPKGGSRGIFSWTDHKKISIKLFYALTIIISLVSIILAKSEGAIIALICGTIIFAFLYNKRSRFLASIMMIFMLLTGAGIYLKYGKTWNELFSQSPLFSLDNICDSSQTMLEGLRIKGNQQTSIQHNLIPYKTSRWPLGCKIYQKLTLQDFSGTIRRQIWQETFAMLKLHPILGGGLASYQNAVKQYHTKNYVEIYLYPHNIILNFWSETGLLGLLAFIFIIVIFFFNGLKNFKSSHNIFILSLMAAMAVILVHGLVDVPYFKNDLAVLFWSIVGLMLISSNVKKTPKQP